MKLAAAVLLAIALAGCKAAAPASELPTPSTLPSAVSVEDLVERCTEATDEEDRLFWWMHLSWEMAQVHAEHHDPKAESAYGELLERHARWQSLRGSIRRLCDDSTVGQLEELWSDTDTAMRELRSQCRVVQPGWHC